MKTLQLSISLNRSGLRVSRKALIPSRSDFLTLHKLIQLAFGLDDVEHYAFILNNLIIRRNASGRYAKSAATTLNKLNADDQFTYHYDLLEDLTFKIKVEAVINRKENYPELLSGRGDNLSEKLYLHRTPFNLSWCNEVLRSLKDDQRIMAIHNRIHAAFKELTAIRNWQDYVYRSCFKIDTPQARSYYVIGTVDEFVTFDFFVNENKLAEFLNMNTEAMDYSAVRYHDTINLTISKLDYREDRTVYDYTSSAYGCFLSRYNVFNPNQALEVEELAYVAEMLPQIAAVVKKLAAANQKAEMLQLHIHRDGSYEVGELIHSCPIMLDLSDEILNDWPQNCTGSLEIDVAAVYDETARKAENMYPVLLIFAEGEQIDEYRLDNASLKTIAYHIYDILLDRLKTHGPYAEINVRDQNVAGFLEAFQAKYNTKINVHSHLFHIDEYVIDTYFMDLFDEYPLSREEAIEDMRQAGMEPEIIDFYRTMSDDEFDELKQHIDQLIDVFQDDPDLLEALDELSDADRELEEAIIDYKKLS